MARSNAAKLKRLGIIPQNWNLRKKLHPSRRKIVERLSSEHAFVLQNIDNFAIRKVSRETASMLRASGYKTVGDKALLPAWNTWSIHVNGKRGTIVTEKKNSVGARVRETTYLPNHPNFARTLARVQRENEDHVPGIKEAWSFKIGDGNVFLKTHPQLSSLMGYGHLVQFKDPSAAYYAQLVHVEYLDA